MSLKRRQMVDGYLIVDRKSGLVRAFRRNVIAAFAAADASGPGALVMMVRIPVDQESLYRTAEIVRGDRS